MCLSLGYLFGVGVTGMLAYPPSHLPVPAWVGTVHKTVWVSVGVFVVGGGLAHY